MGGWIEQHRLARALCFAVPLSMVLAACTTGFNPGLGVGGRCMSTTGAPGSTNYFSYGPDCTNGAGPNHWIYKVWKAGYPDLQEGPIGLTDKTVSPIAKVGNTASHFQTTWYREGSNYDVEMNLKAGAVDDEGGQVDFDFGNVATDGIPGLHSHHEIAMYGGSGTFQTSYILLFSVGTDHYWLNYVLPPHTKKAQSGEPSGVMYHNDWSDDGGVNWNHIINLEASYFHPTMNLKSGWTTVDIDWTSLVNFVKSERLWTSLNINATKGQTIEESFYESGFGPKNGALGGVDTVQRNWTMEYK